MGQAASRNNRERDVQDDPQRRRRWSTAFRPANSRTTSEQSQAISSSSRVTPSSHSPTRRQTRLCRARNSISNNIPQFLSRRRQSQIIPQGFGYDATRSWTNVDTTQAISANTSHHSDGADTGLNDEQPLDFVAARRSLAAAQPRLSRSSSPLARIREMMPSRPLRRRRSRVTPLEDQASVLTELLSAAAAATANSILGGDAVSPSSRNLVGDENGAFGDFLTQLRSGNIASALRSGNSDNGSNQSLSPHDMNFFRMFRFGATDGTTASDTPTDAVPSTETLPGEDISRAVTTAGEGRMVPIIIVGIRSINPGSNNDVAMPPFFENLANVTPEGTTDTSVDALLRPSRNNSTFSHRRRTSTNSIRGLRPFQPRFDAMDSPPESALRRRRSINYDAISPRAPPATPASAGLSAFSSGATTPTTSTPTPISGQSAAASRRGSVAASRRNTSTLEYATDPALRPRIPRTRRFSEDFDLSRHGAGAPRRNGVVGPESAETEGEPHRSWIIYVLGGSYPENHPLLSTPSLFTDNPQYEDMLLLASLLGPAKPPVATEEEIARAAGLYKVRRVVDSETRLEAIEILNENETTNIPAIVEIALEERCLVCLCDYEPEEQARRLHCKHLFHQDCIDQWLLTGRNSCPLCRKDGVQKSEEATGEGPSTPESGDVAGSVSLDRPSSGPNLMVPS